MSIKRKVADPSSANDPLVRAFAKRNEAYKKSQAKRKLKPGFMELIMGSKGAGKSYASIRIEEEMVKEVEKQLEQNYHDEEYTPKVAVITDEELKELNEPQRNYFRAADVFAYGSGGGGGTATPAYEQEAPDWVKQKAYSFEQQSNPWQQQPPPQPPQQSFPWRSNNWGSYPATPQVVPPVEESKKEKFNPEERKGKFCAFVTIIVNNGAGISIEHTGILFVKKCGHWKLCGINGDKLAGGTAGSFEGDIRKGRMKVEVHRTIYDAEAPVYDESDLEII